MYVGLQIITLCKGSGQRLGGLESSSRFEVVEPDWSRGRSDGVGGSDTIPNLVQGCQDSGIINQNFDYYSCKFCISPYIINHVIRWPNLVNRNQVINHKSSRTSINQAKIPNLVQKSGSVGPLGRCGWYQYMRKGCKQGQLLVPRDPQLN